MPLTPLFYKALSQSGKNVLSMNAFSLFTFSYPNLFFLDLTYISLIQTSIYLLLPSVYCLYFSFQLRQVCQKVKPDGSSLPPNLISLLHCHDVTYYQDNVIHHDSLSPSFHSSQNTSLTTIFSLHHSTLPKKNNKKNFLGVNFSS